MCPYPEIWFVVIGVGFVILVLGFIGVGLWFLVREIIEIIKIRRIGKK